MNSESRVVPGIGPSSRFDLKTISFIALLSLSWRIIMQSSRVRLSSALTNWLSTLSSALLMKWTQKSYEFVQLSNDLSSKLSLSLTILRSIYHLKRYELTLAVALIVALNLVRALTSSNLDIYNLSWKNQVISIDVLENA